MAKATLRVNGRLMLTLAVRVDVDRRLVREAILNHVATGNDVPRSRAAALDVVRDHLRDWGTRGGTGMHDAGDAASDEARQELEEWEGLADAATDALFPDLTQEA